MVRPSPGIPEAQKKMAMRQGVGYVNRTETRRRLELAGQRGTSANLDMTSIAHGLRTSSVSVGHEIYSQVELGGSAPMPVEPDDNLYMAPSSGSIAYSAYDPDDGADTESIELLDAIIPDFVFITNLEEQYHASKTGR